MIATVIRRRASNKHTSDVLNVIGQSAGAAPMNAKLHPSSPSAAVRAVNSISRDDPLGREATQPLLDPNGDLERPWVLQP